MKVCRPFGQVRLHMGIVALGVAISACSGSTAPSEDLQSPDATSDAREEGTLAPPSDDSSVAPEDATVGTPLESGVGPSDAAGEGGMTSPPGQDGAVSDGGPQTDAGPMAEGGPDSGPEAGPIADGGTDAPSGPDATPADAGLDGAASDGGGEGGSLASTDSIVKTVLGEACYACASDPNTAGCLDQGVDCEDIEGAVQPPATAASRTQLCLQTLTCVLQSGCEVIGSATHPGTGLACYCGDVSFDACEESPAVGACRAIEESGLGTTDPATILENFFDDNDYGAGMANSVALCMFQSCPSQCFGQ